MKKNNLHKIFLILSLVIFSERVFAADFEVYCDDNVDGDQCNVVSGDKIFNDSNLLPGATISRTIEVTNDDHNDDCELKMKIQNESSTHPDLPGKFFTAFKEDGSLYYGNLDSSGNAASGKTLDDVFNSTITFSSIPHSGGTVLLEWLIKFDPLTGNDFQAKSTQFDVQLNFECDHDESDNGDDDDGDDGSVAGTTTATFSRFFAPVEVFVESPESPVEEEDVKGVQTQETVEGVGTCVDPWWLWLIFVLQFLVTWLVNLFLGEKTLDKRGWLQLLQLILSIIFVIYFYRHFCIWWDYIISILLGLFWLILFRLKVYRLKE